MKKPHVILLLILVLLPIIWNGVSFFHYLSEHTHTFCESEIDHHHSTVDDCESIYDISKGEDQNHLLTKVEFYEIKQFITPRSIISITSHLSTASALIFECSIQLERLFSEDIFHPPIV